MILSSTRTMSRGSFLAYSSEFRLVSSPECRCSYTRMAFLTFPFHCSSDCATGFVIRPGVRCTGHQLMLPLPNEESRSRDCLSHCNNNGACTLFSIHEENCFLFLAQEPTCEGGSPEWTSGFRGSCYTGFISSVSELFMLFPLFLQE